MSIALGMVAPTELSMYPSSQLHAWSTVRAVPIAGLAVCAYLVTTPSAHIVFKAHTLIINALTMYALGPAVPLGAPFPENPRLHSYLPSTQTPLPLQSLGHSPELQSAELYP